MGLLKEFEYDLDNGETPEPTTDVSQPLTSDALTGEMKELADQVVAKIKAGSADGTKYIVSIHGREVPIQKLIPLKDKIKAEHDRLASENPAETHDESQSFKLIRVVKGKKFSMDIPAAMFI